MAFEDIHRPLSNAGFRGAIQMDSFLISGVMLIAQQLQDNG